MSTNHFNIARWSGIGAALVIMLGAVLSCLLWTGGKVLAYGPLPDRVTKVESRLDEHDRRIGNLEIEHDMDIFMISNQLQWISHRLGKLDETPRQQGQDASTAANNVVSVKP